MCSEYESTLVNAEWWIGGSYITVFIYVYYTGSHVFCVTWNYMCHSVYRGLTDYFRALGIAMMRTVSFRATFIQFSKMCAPSEDRIHDLEIMRFTRCLLRHRNHILENYAYFIMVNI